MAPATRSYCHSSLATAVPTGRCTCCLLCFGVLPVPPLAWLCCCYVCCGVLASADCLLLLFVCLCSTVGGTGSESLTGVAVFNTNRTAAAATPRAAYGDVLAVGYF